MSTRKNKGSREQVVTIIAGVSRKKGLLGLKRETYTLVVTDQRLLFARVNKALLATQKEELNALRRKNKAAGKGFFASWGESMVSGMSWYNRYQAMDPESILAESRDNFPLDKAEILSLKTNEQLGLNQADPNTPLPFITIKTRKAKCKYLLPRSYDPDALNILKTWFKSA